ncbi:MAG: hypothetical protein WA631_00865, partial [Nitrososphaeraceae archaeon]
PYDYHRYRVFANHDTIIDEHAQIMGSFIWKPHNNNNSYNGDMMTTQTKVRVPSTTATATVT